MIHKKIKYVTWIGWGNYGTCLQSYALYKVLKDKGYEVEWLAPFYKKNWIKSYILLLLEKVGVNEWRRKRTHPKTLQDTKILNFQKENYSVCRIYTEKQYKNMLKTTDVFISGSDQIWNTYVSYDPYMFLEFANGSKKISYASSIGTDNVPEQYRERMKNALAEYSHISVREKTAVGVLESVTNRHDIVQVLDPTFLVTPNMWKELTEKAVIEFKLPDKYILCYLIGKREKYKEQLCEIVEKTGINNVIIIKSQENKSFTIKNAIPYENASPIEFVALINRATLVCTDSFHATAISINLSKDFIEFMRFDDNNENSQNSRINDLLKQYDLTCRKYSNIHGTSMIEPVNYDKVQTKLENDRMTSMSYLINSIEN